MRLRAFIPVDIAGISYPQFRDDSLFHLPPERYRALKSWTLRDKGWDSVGIKDLFAALNRGEGISLACLIGGSIRGFTTSPH